ncbi:MAG: hypothetical protein ACKOA8_11845, partial [Deltaproteobacteria bacterium]
FNPSFMQTFSNPPDKTLGPTITRHWKLRIVYENNFQSALTLMKFIGTRKRGLPTYWRVSKSNYG